jgi:hypothetical protein
MKLQKIKVCSGPEIYNLNMEKPTKVPYNHENSQNIFLKAVNERENTFRNGMDI